MIGARGKYAPARVYSLPCTSFRFPPRLWRGRCPEGAEAANLAHTTAESPRAGLRSVALPRASAGGEKARKPITPAIVPASSEIYAIVVSGLGPRASRPLQGTGGMPAVPRYAGNVILFLHFEHGAVFEFAPFARRSVEGAVRIRHSLYRRQSLSFRKDCGRPRARGPQATRNGHKRMKPTRLMLLHSTPPLDNWRQHILQIVAQYHFAPR